MADVPSLVDLRDPSDALNWASSAQLRPGRAETFRAFLSQLAEDGKDAVNVLELGSGPGFLAEFLLSAMPELRITLLDYSAAMHDLARARLGDRAGRVIFLLRDFKSPAWTRGLIGFDVVITNQAVHELRHKQYAPALHSQIALVLAPGGTYLVADHYCGDGGMTNDQLFMSVEEQAAALRSAGYRSVELISKSGSLVLHRAAQPLVQSERARSP